MKTQRAFVLLGVLLLVAGAGTAAFLDRWFMSWPGCRAQGYSPLQLAIGEGQKIFAGHFYRKADVYFHSGMYPSIFDNNDSFKTAHIGEDAGATRSKNSGDEDNFLGKPRDIIDRFSRNFFPSRHTHLDQGGAGGHAHPAGGQVLELGEGDSGEVREILPWLKLAQELDPEDPLTYTVTAYWLRNRMNKAGEAEALLRDGLRHLPNHPVLLFELGRIYSEQHADLVRACNIWRAAISAWHRQERSKSEPDLFILEQLLTHVAKAEEQTGEYFIALDYWQQALAVAPDREGIPQRIAELEAKLAAKPASP